MNRRKYIKTIALGALLPGFVNTGFPLSILNDSLNEQQVTFKSNWHNWKNMKWVGPEYWGNRLQDWELINGRVICNISGVNRTLQLLTVQKTSSLSAFSISVEIDMLLSNLETDQVGCFGLRLGAKGQFDDYRSAAVFGKGFDIGLLPNGNLKLGAETIETGLKTIPKQFQLQVKFSPSSNDYNLTVDVKDTKSKQTLFTTVKSAINKDVVAGNFALLSDIKVAKAIENNPTVAFSNWEISGSQLYQNEEQLFGPICFAQYTLHAQTLKITGQFAPIESIPNHKILLQFKRHDTWETYSEHQLKHQGRAVSFRIENWQENTDIPYRIIVEIPLKTETHQYTYEGTIAEEPLNIESISAAVFSCNFHYGFPDTDVYENVSKLNPDIILFLGDQFYEGTGGFGAQYYGDLDKSCLDYLRKWMMFGWSYRELFRHKPCAIIPDDHDVYHGNVWGESGGKADISEGYGASSQDSGGYKMPADWVNMVQFTQTSHLPDPYDATPVKQNIGMYYTQWNYGGLSFAILEDRKFKSAPKHILPEEAKIWNGFITNPDFDIKKYKNLEATLLGERQHKFIDDWADDWGSNIEMKVVLSQTNFATVATLPKGTLTDDIVPKLSIPEKGVYVKGDAPTVDMDSNGWPSNKRDQAIQKIRKCFAFHIAGDQHLGSFIQYGIDNFGDSGYAFAGPALNNIWPRRFWPDINYAEHTYKNPAYVGNHIDGFGNKITVKAVANPFNTGKTPEIVHNRATGYGLVTFNKKDRTIKTECWARYANPQLGEQEQLPGWPITISQEMNYGREAEGFLPELIIKGGSNPVVQVFDETLNEIIYTIRIKGNRFQPKVFSKAHLYTLIVGTDLSDKAKVNHLTHIKVIPNPQPITIQLKA
ncbi:PhoD-like phosphatase [Formosa agariphila KMM 3901]|uniref:PhoD-like phosphatase n=1 Tax=Formosa agariphila (strain DSM 15362 / KCTC 12365 / LMG 23005 / KMM 3901 / M-2Alg 35-1) TaxID=1347342 RepID=T2KPG3_FORAG|nr:alkaline phosphatase D family protein [Formosa agariphila]CDF80336.1 PhoD-like phosphatase [Formosa agariphila KMM 3901]